MTSTIEVKSNTHINDSTLYTDLRYTFASKFIYTYLPIRFVTFPLDIPVHSSSIFNEI